MRAFGIGLPYEMVEQGIKEGGKGNGGCDHCRNTDPPQPRMLKLKDGFEGDGGGSRKEQNFAGNDLFAKGLMQPLGSTRRKLGGVIASVFFKHAPLDERGEKIKEQIKRPRR